MANAAGVRAGRAYVELGVNDSAFLKSMRSGMAQLRQFGAGMMTLGTQMTLLGAGIVAPLVASVKSFADAGAGIARLQQKTGLGLDALNGLAEAARQADLPIDVLSATMRHLEKSIGDGTKQTEDAFNRLGTSSAQLTKMSPEAALGLLADRLKQVTDVNEKAALAQTLFGRSGTELIPILDRGSAGLNALADAARKNGTALNGLALAAAMRLHDAFKGLEDSLLALRNALGPALETAFVPLLNGLSMAAQALAQWVAKNPEQVQAFFNLALGVGALGVAFTLLGAAIYAAMSPAILATAAITGIGLALLAVSDVLELTQTGFGNLFNAIRIDGTGLGTWFGAFTVQLAKIWNELATDMEASWDAFVNGAKNAGSYIYQALVWVPQKLLEAFRYMVDKAGDALNSLAGVWNDTLGKVTGKTIDIKFGSAGVFDDTITNMQAKQNQISLDRATRNADHAGTRDAKWNESNLIADNLDKQQQRIFGKDAQDAGGSHIDTQKFRDALSGIGGNVGQLMRDAIGQIPELTGFKPADIGKVSPFGSASGTINNAIDSAQKHIDVAGTFNASVAGELGFGSSIQERTARAAEETARNTKDTLDLVRNNGASFT